MRHKVLRRVQEFLPGAFTLSGKCRAAPRDYSARFARTAIPLLLLAMGTPLAARPQIGPTSSTSLEISLSVAPRYTLESISAGLGPKQSGAAGSGALCISTNGPQTALPVMLVHPATSVPGSREHAAERIARLAWCRPDGDRAQAEAGEVGSSGQGPLIIRPE